MTLSCSAFQILTAAAAAVAGKAQLSRMTMVDSLKRWSNYRLLANGIRTEQGSGICGCMTNTGCYWAASG